MNGRNVGISRYAGYTYNERALVSLAMVDVDVPIGSEVSLTWGEEERGSRRPVVERHRQIEIRAVVSPCPYSEVTRTVYKA
jgi:vanillate/3-O-methylgallate O-demethylase